MDILLAICYWQLVNHCQVRPYTCKYERKYHRYEMFLISESERYVENGWNIKEMCGASRPYQP